MSSGRATAGSFPFLVPAGGRAGAEPGQHRAKKTDDTAVMLHVSGPHLRYHFAKSADELLP